MPGAEPQEISTGRKGAAALSMMAAAGGIGYEAIRHLSPDWIVVAFAGMLAAGGIALTRRSLIGQILARGAALTLFVPAGAAVVAESMFMHRMPGATETICALGTGAALMLARPMLHTNEAKAAFDPHRFRSIFLAGSTATTAAAFLTGGVALEMASFGGSFWTYAGSAGFAALTLALLATAIGVVRMRAWGILLGAATAIMLLLTSLFVGHGEGNALMLLAAPMLVLHTLPILLARYGPAKAAAAEPTRYRIAAESATQVELEEDLLDAYSEELPQEGCKVHV